MAKLSDQGVRSSILSTVSVTSVTSRRIFYTVESKLTSLIGMTIFNNVLQFRIGQEDTFRAMISAAINISRYYTLPGRDTVQEPLLDNCFDNHIKNQIDKLTIGADIYGIHFQGNGATIKDTPLLNILSGVGVHLPVSVQNILYYTDNITGVLKKDAKTFVEGFFDPLDDLDTEKKLLDLNMFDGASL